MVLFYLFNYYIIFLSFLKPIVHFTVYFDLFEFIDRIEETEREDLLKLFEADIKKVENLVTCLQFY